MVNFLSYMLFFICKVVSFFTIMNHIVSYIPLLDHVAFQGFLYGEVMN